MITLEESRYARQELITWWDQARLRESRVLVVGAGALGNEIVKNLSLLGVGHITVVDMDRIERSNLARCAMFVDADEGHFKAEALAEAARRLNPEVTAAAVPVSVMTLGLGTVASFDIVIAGLDNREARLWINRACR
jgi:molybdopterin/thiamine biosynthesis adenylyltransferase